jgi:catechol 2,3-dioxygenase-like lactoylglutathione lyase family enzyme
VVSILSQYCIYVSDIDRAIAFWRDVVGIPLVSETDIPNHKEAIHQSPHGGSRLQLAQKLDDDAPIDMGTAMWKLYANTSDCQALYDRAMAAGCESVTPPSRLDRWPVTMAYIKEPDGYLVEFVEYHEGTNPGVPDPKEAAAAGELVSILSQYCIYVRDMDAAIEFWRDVVGIPLVSETDIPNVREAILQSPYGGSRMQLAEKVDDDAPIDMGNAMWKLYVNTDDCQALYDRAIAARCESVTPPARTERWPVTIAFVKNADGYLVEFVEYHEGTNPGVPDPKQVARST